MIELNKFIDIDRTQLKMIHYERLDYTSLNLYEILVNWFSNAPTRPLAV